MSQFDKEAIHKAVLVSTQEAFSTRLTLNSMIGYIVEATLDEVLKQLEVKFDNLNANLAIKKDNIVFGTGYADFRTGQTASGEAYENQTAVAEPMIAPRTKAKKVL